MTIHEYQLSREPEVQYAPFYALIMAAMRQADTTNLRKLQAAFPETWRELEARYNAPGGRLPDDPETPGVNLPCDPERGGADGST